MMKGAYLVSKFLCHSHFRQQLIGTITMDLHQQLAAQHIGEGLQLQIALRPLRVFVASLHLGVVLLPISLVFLSLNQRLPLHRKIAHTSGRQLIAAAVHAFRIFPAGELDGSRSSRK